MNCNELKQYLSPYLDNELESHINVEIESHLEQCDSCRKLFQIEHYWESSIKSNIVASFETQKKWDNVLNRFANRPKPKRFKVPVLVSCLLVAIFFVAYFVQVNQESSLVKAAVRNHYKYVSDNMPLKIFSNSPMEVEEYFQGKLSYAVSLPYSYKMDNVKLIGARNCHLEELPVAFLVYSVENEPVSVFLMDDRHSLKFDKVKHTLNSLDVDQLEYRNKSVIISPSKGGVLVAIANLTEDKLYQFTKSFL